MTGPVVARAGWFTSRRCATSVAERTRTAVTSGHPREPASASAIAATNSSGVSAWTVAQRAPTGFACQLVPVGYRRTNQMSQRPSYCGWITAS